MKPSSIFAALALSVVATGCAASHDLAPAAASPSRSAEAAAPLDRSLFSRDVTGSVSEPDLQRILASPVDLAFPARIGVVALAAPFRAEAGADLDEQAIVARVLTSSITGATAFSHVTDVSTDLPNPAGIEGLRTIAARYRLRYLLLVSARTDDRSHLNNWAWLYATGVGVFLAPGMTVATKGLVQASLFDVKSGTVLFTAVEPFETSKVTWLVGHGRDQASTDAKAMSDATERLARSVLAETDAVRAWAETEKTGSLASREAGK